MNNNTTFNLNIASYFLNILASPYVLKWNTIVGPITKTINHPGLTKIHQRKVEIMWLLVYRCKYMGVQYKGNNITKHFGKTTFKNNWMNSILLHILWKTILNCATQTIWLTVFNTTEVSIKCVSPLLIWPFKESNL